jgi:hypothetical protein
MIRRPSGKDHLLVTQPDHAALSGMLASHIGNDRYSSPDRRSEFISAVAMHDAGWESHDAAPILNAAGFPLHVFETPPTLSTRIWSCSVERAADLGPYAALLVSLHHFALSDLSIRARQLTPRDVFELNKFQHNQIELQESLRKQLGLRTDNPLYLGLASPGADPAEDQLRFNFRLLTLCDRLSLELCCGKAIFPTIEEILARPGARALTLQTQMPDHLTLRVDPWPFDGEVIVGDIPCRRVTAQRFADEAAFRASYAAAPVESVQFQLRSGHP